MQQQQTIPTLAPYGSLAFLPMATKVGVSKGPGVNRSTSAMDQRKVVRRKSSI